MIHTVIIKQADNLDAFRTTARRLLAAGVSPANVIWNSSDSCDALFDQTLPHDEQIMAVPRSFVSLSSAVVCHRDNRSWALLYEALWRMNQGERALMQQPSDPLVHRLNRLAAAVKHDQHRMTAFVRFRMVPDPDGELYIAWYEPRHRVLRRVSGFFVNRFAGMRFSILTPDLTLHWNRNVEQFGPGLERKNAASEDAVENWWRCYYAAIFNPARANSRLMQQHMPKRFWRDLPEAQTIASLIGEAGARTDRMISESN